MPGSRPDAIDCRFYFSYQAAGIGGLLFDLFDPETVLGEKLRFGFENLVFASRLNVAVVHAQHAETCRFRGNRKSKRGHRLTTWEKARRGRRRRPFSRN